MSIASALTALSGDITAARAAVTAKGGTVTTDGGSSQLAGDIASIPSGGIPVRITAWRPPDMPDITSLPVDNTKVWDSWYTIDLGACDYEEISEIQVYGRWDIDFGNIVNGQFTSIQKNHKTSVGWGAVTLPELPSDQGKFLIIHITTDSDNAIFWDASYTQGTSGYMLPIVEEYVGGTKKATFVGSPYITISNQSAFGGTLPSGAQVCDFSKCETVSLNNSAFDNSGNTLRYFYPPKNGFRSTFGYPVRKITTLQTIDLSNSIFNNLQLQYFLSECYGLRTLFLKSTELNASSGGKILKNCYQLKNIICDAQTILPAVSFSMADCSRLTDISLVSVANALPVVTTSTTLTLHATPKANLSTILGTVTDGVFTADEEGAVTLLDFITNTKGWTVA